MSILTDIPIKTQLTEAQYFRESWIAAWSIVFGFAAAMYDGGMVGMLFAVPGVLLLQGVKLNGSSPVSPALRLAGLAGCALLGAVVAVQMFPNPVFVFPLAFVARVWRVGQTTWGHVWTG